jgi:hypothetical protein
VKEARRDRAFLLRKPNGLTTLRSVVFASTSDKVRSS